MLTKTEILVTENNHCTEQSANFSCSLYKLRLKFDETTRVVCTDFAEC